MDLPSIRDSLKDMHATNLYRSPAFPQAIVIPMHRRITPLSRLSRKLAAEHLNRRLLGKSGSAVRCLAYKGGAGGKRDDKTLGELADDVVDFFK